MLRHSLPWSLSLLLSSASAAAASSGYRVDWSAPGDCGGVEQLEREVSARRSGLQIERDGAPVSIEVERDLDGYHLGRITLPDGTQREVRAIQCGDVVSALAFILVVAIDPGGPELASSPIPPPERTSQPAPRWRASVGITGGIAGGRTRQPMPVVGPFFELWQSETPFLRGARLSAVLGAGPLASAPDDVAVRFGGAVANLCPVGVSFASLCGGLELGAEYLKSSSALSNVAATRWSMSGRIGGQLRWELEDHWVLDLGLGARLPLTLDEFQILRRDGTKDTVYSASISGYALASIGYRP